MKDNDVVYLSVKPIDTKTVVVKYNDFNRRFVFDPIDFVGSDVDTVRNLITITDHDYSEGDKVIYTSDSPVGGMENQEFYYVVPYDRNRIRLVTNKYEALTFEPNVC